MIEEPGKELVNRLKTITTNEMWAVILVAAGHFAAAIFKGYLH